VGRRGFGWETACTVGRAPGEGCGFGVERQASGALNVGPASAAPLPPSRHGSTAPHVACDHCCSLPESSGSDRAGGYAAGERMNKKTPRGIARSPSWLVRDAVRERAGSAGVGSRDRWLREGRSRQGPGAGYRSCPGSPVALCGVQRGSQAVRWPHAFRPRGSMGPVYRPVAWRGLVAARLAGAEDSP